jgi:ferredoxin--NADP+ reductase
MYDGKESAMFKIIESQFLSRDVKLFRVLAPRIARKQQAGQFVILRVNEHGERIPITIAGSDPIEGSVSIIVQGIGKTTKMLNELQVGDYIHDFVGPLGLPSDVKNYGNVVVIGGGVGTAIAYPIAKALKLAGNKVTTIIGAKTKDLLILENKMNAVSDLLCVTTDDGSYGQKGFVSDRLLELLESGVHVDYVFAVGPVLMMQAVAETTRSRDIKTVVSLNAIMVDGTGMCGGCRVTIGGKSKFACVDGPEFDAHLVDFISLKQRTAMYKAMERVSLDRFEETHDNAALAEGHVCRLTGTERTIAPVFGG